MALFFDYKVQSPLIETNYLFFEWHSTFPILAIASYSRNSTGQVHLHFEEGEYDDSAIIQRAPPPCSMAWHPKKKILTICWEGGEITIWSDITKKLETPSSLHECSIVSLAYSSNGTRLLTGDERGNVVLWRVDANGKLAPQVISQFSINERITNVLCKPSNYNDQEKDLRELARAAVSGDENALEAFDYKRSARGKPNQKLEKPPVAAYYGISEALCFIISGNKGSVYFVNENGKSNKLFQMDDPIMKLLYNQERLMLVAITENLMLGQYILKSETEATNLMTVKLNGKPHESDFTWIGNNLLAYVSGENAVRVLDIAKDENYILPLSTKYDYSLSEELISISYSPGKSIIAASTNRGNVAMWKYSPHKMKLNEPESSWQLLQAKMLLHDAPIKNIKFGTSQNLLCANLITDAFILSEQKMSSDFRDGLAVVQLGPTIIHLAFFNQNLVKEEKVDMQFKGLATAKNHVVVWNGKQVRIFEMLINNNTADLDEKISREERGNFTCFAFGCAIYEQNIYTLEPSKINVRTYQGTVKQALQFTENEGDPFLASINGSFLAVGTTQGIIKVYDLSRREAKQIGGSLNLKKMYPLIECLHDISLSCDGNKIAITVRKRNNIPDSKLYLWNLDKDLVGYFDFEKGVNDIDEVSFNNNDREDRTAYEKSKQDIAKRICGRYPGLHHWEHSDPRLLVCEIFLLHSSSVQNQLDTMESQDKRRESDEPPECMVVSLFFNSDAGLLVYDSYPRDEIYSKLISVRIPYHFFVTKGRMIESDGQKLVYEGYQVPKQNSFTDSKSRINGTESQMTSYGFVTEYEHSKDYLFYSEFLAARVMRDFIGMTETDKNTTDALLNFSYFLTIGDMDEAFKAIRLIKKESVWENMAKMCVKSHRIDVAKVCLGNMNNLQGIRLLRNELENEPDTETQAGLIALCLGMKDEAERLFVNSKRYDLLNKMYQSSDQWEKAMEVAQKFDRIHLRNTFYNYAKYCEEKNDLNAAIEYYEKADAHRKEVPRMYLERNELVGLHTYTQKIRDKELYRWWGQYFESIGNMENAIMYHQEANDNFALCRVHCINENIDKAIQLCNDTNDPTACYYLARQFERNKNYKEAINYYQRSGCLSNAIRICKENDMNEYMANLAFQGSSNDMLEAARHYETVSGQEDKAVILYHKAGHTSKAVDLAFRANKYSALALITDGITEKSDPQLVVRVANFFLENEQFDKAVDLLAVSKKIDQALDLLLKHNVPITEELANKLTPVKPTDEVQLPTYYATLESLGDAAFDQRQYTLAAKKYTEANNRMKAMKALMKSGDTQRVIFFANVQKQRETYIMAANYLQSLDWKKDPDIMKHIISFYTRGKAMISLSSFYEACSQVEIDEFQDYEKAINALEEAYRCLTRSTTEDTVRSEEMMNKIKMKLALMRKFLEAKSKLAANSEDGLKDLYLLLQASNVDYAVRIGDIFSMIIEYQAKSQRWKQAYAALKEMREHIAESSIPYYVDPKLLVLIHRELNIDYKVNIPDYKTAYGSGGGGGGYSGSNDDDIKDDIGYGAYED